MRGKVGKSESDAYKGPEPIVHWDEQKRKIFKSRGSRVSRTRSRMRHKVVQAFEQAAGEEARNVSKVRAFHSCCPPDVGELLPEK